MFQTMIEAVDGSEHYAVEWGAIAGPVVVVDLLRPRKTPKAEITVVAVKSALCRNGTSVFSFISKSEGCS